MDCGGLLYEVYGKFYPLKPYPDTYPADWSMHQGAELYLDFIADYVSEIGNPPVAGIVVFRYGRCYSHGGILTESNTVIHAWGRTQHGMVIESPMSFFNDKRSYRPRKYYNIKAPANGR